VQDVGADEYEESDDYTDFAGMGAAIVSKNPSEYRGVFLCGSGHGVDIVANKYRGVRAAIGFNLDVVKQSREHDDANVLVIPADWVDEEEAKQMATLWLGTEFSGEERHVRRLKKLENVEEENFK
jgi:ribose 5-phosphate isomerase B